MEKRTFLRSAIGISAMSVLESVGARTAAPAEPVLLTISGRVSHPNRGPLDDALDQLMLKQGVAFKRARAFTYAELDGMPSSEIRPVLEYDAKRHTLRGPTLLRLLEIAGASGDEGTLVRLRAVDGYAAAPTLAEVTRFQFIVATRIDGEPLPLGGLGPLWGVFDPGRIPELAGKPLAAQFAQCPWGLYSVHFPEAGGK
jgi:hypothetical protein